MDIRPTGFALTLVLCASCAGPSTPPTERDTSGHYATTSDYDSMLRTDFMRAMRAGLYDFDDQMEKLQKRANDLGGESLEEYAGFSDDLRNARERFASQLEKVDAAMTDDWPERRSETIEQYRDLRELLDDAYADVLET